MKCTYYAFTSQKLFSVVVYNQGDATAAGSILKASSEKLLIVNEAEIHFEAVF